MVLGIFAVLDADSPSHMVTDPTGAAICLVHQPDPINKNPPINVSINIPAPLGSVMGMAVDGTYQPIGGATDWQGGAPVSSESQMLVGSNNSQKPSNTYGL